METKKSDIIAVAKAARVSPSTVSRSFNHPELVKASTRKRIDAAVRRLGYIRNRAAQTIHGIRSGTVGLIVPTVDHAIFAELIQSFAESIEEFGFTILLATHGYDLQREYALTRKMLEHRVDGVALIGVEHAKDTLDLLQEQDTPTLFLWNYDENSSFTCVGSDNRLAGRLIGEHILSLGHRAVAVVFPPLDGNDRATQRHEGFKEVFEASKVPFAPAWQLEAPYSVAAAKTTVERLLDGKERPTAILCGNDVLAWGALHAISKLGLRVPADISVTGIGDFKGSLEFEPPLTTVRIPARQIGKQGAEAIAAAIKTPDAPTQGGLISPELIVRDTSGPAANR